MNLYQLNIGLNHLYETCLAQFASKVPSDFEHIVLTSNPYAELNRFTDIRTMSNGLRFKLLSQSGDNMWADADTTVGEWPENLDRSKPWISSPNGRFPNGSVMISFGHGGWFDSIYAEYMNEKHFNPMTYAEILLRHKGEYNLLPKKYFNEINLSSTNCSNVISVGNENFSVVKDENNKWIFKYLKGVIDI
jgi:hypothetical protein